MKPITKRTLGVKKFKRSGLNMFTYYTECETKEECDEIVKSLIADGHRAFGARVYDCLIAVYVRDKKLD